MGVRNYLIEGVSCSGKTSVCDELRDRGYAAIHGDRELAYQGNPKTGEPLDGLVHEHHIWDITKLRAMVKDRSQAVSFFCGGSRNVRHFLDLFDCVFVLEIDKATLHRRLARRSAEEFGGKPAEKKLIAHLHATGADVPEGATIIDATVPVARVVDEILSDIGIDD